MADCGNIIFCSLYSNGSCRCIDDSACGYVKFVKIHAELNGGQKRFGSWRLWLWMLLLLFVIILKKNMYWKSKGHLLFYIFSTRAHVISFDKSCFLLVLITRSSYFSDVESRCYITRPLLGLACQMFAKTSLSLLQNTAWVVWDPSSHAHYSCCSKRLWNAFQIDLSAVCPNTTRLLPDCALLVPDAVVFA